MAKTISAFFLFILLSITSLSLAAQGKPDTTGEKSVRVYTTTRLTTEPPKIDGVLDDACWDTGEWAGDYTQWIPNEGAEPSQPTQLKILYDDRNLYVAIRAFDSEPDKISLKGGRRDELNGDMAGVTFDSYHDHRTGFEFSVTAAGQKVDLVLMNPVNWDVSWDAVWYVKTGLEDSAWVAEYRIPLSQLRYSNEYEQVWGLHSWRWIERLQEESDWEPQSSTGPGILYQFGELRGIKGLPPMRRIEIMPYALGRFNTFRKEPENPFADRGRSSLGNLGLDAKIGLSSNFTADVTINPDFGQVEADPSVMNLTAFETFFQEKRPFFLEGKNIFSFDAGDASLFYSRRIGQAPGYTPDLQSGEYMKYPDNTTILSAMKVSGKTANGLSVGVLQSLTARETAQVRSDGNSSRIGVEPMTNYFIARIQRDFNQGNTMLGGILSSTNRFIQDARLEFFNHDAYSGGLDFLHHWHDKEFFLDAKLLGSQVLGSTEAIDNLQTSSARYFQRPDAGHLHFDPARTRLGGHGGRIRIGKGSKGLWRYSTQVDWYSPGLDLNDLGFMQRADIIEQENDVSYFVNKPVGIFRTYSVGARQFNHWDFGLNHLSSGGGVEVSLNFLNKWSVTTSLEYTSRALDTRLLRGGEAMLAPAVWENTFRVETDPSARIVCDVTTDVLAAQNHRTRYRMVQPGITLLPWNVLRLSMSLNYAANREELQYIATPSVAGTDRYLLGRLDQQTLGATFRIDYNITPELSIQYYGSPFASVGEYSRFKTVADPRAQDYHDRYDLVEAVPAGADYQVFEVDPVVPAYTFPNPDFNFRQFRSNLVFRWEYRPGSQLFLVWSQERTEFVQPGHDAVYRSLAYLNDIYPDNIFLLKCSYWFTM